MPVIAIAPQTRMTTIGNQQAAKAHDRVDQSHAPPPSLPQGLKPLVLPGALAARLKPRPFKPQSNRDSGGADRDRTGGLLVANQALSQLSYSPNPRDQGSGARGQQLTPRL
jgi:hypothetical protein